MRKLCGLLAIAIAMVLPVGLSAQGGTVTGRVVDRVTQRPLQDVQVGIANTTRGTLTNEAGEFSIAQVPSGTIQVRASRIGYQQATQTINLMPGQTANVTLALSQAVVELGALVVNATGQEQRVREIGNAVATIETENVDLAPVQNLSQLINGRAPGVAVLPNSGTLGTGSQIQIRGMSSVSLDATPLVLLDGIRVSNEDESSSLFTGGQFTSRIEDLNPEDIASIEILKGPAASALYGTAAANGVIQITTKRGQRGDAQIRGFIQQSNMDVLRSQVPDNFRARGRNALGVRVDCHLVNRANGTCVQLDSLYQYNPLFQASDSPLRTGEVTKYGANISGGSPNGDITYYLSAEADNGTGTTIKNRLDRKNFRANVSTLALRDLRLSVSTGFVDSYIQLPQGDNSGNSIMLTALRGSPDPTNQANFSGFASPYRPTTTSDWDNEEDVRRFTGSINADYRPLSWLSLNGTAGIDNATRYERSFVDAGGLQSGFLALGLREQFRQEDREMTATFNANMLHDLTPGITSSTTGGVQYNESLFNWSFVVGENITPGTKTAAEATAVQEANGGAKLFGVYASQQFGFNDRLFLTGAIRGDQNSAFGRNIGFITYPAASASWVIMEEPWFPQVDFLSNLRLRAAYGRSGLRPGRLDAARVYTDRAAAIEGSITPGYVTDNIGNANLEAEISSELEFGGDLGLLDDRLGFEFTRFDKTTEDALVRRPLPPSLGGPTSQFFNLGEVNNKGWELAVRAEPIRTESFGANFRFNYSANENELVTFGDSIIPPILLGLQRHIQDYPLGGYWAPDYTFSDANGDRLIQSTEVVRVPRLEQDDTTFNTSFVGPSTPTREASFTGDITVFRYFRLSGLLDHKGGHYLFNWGRRQRCADAGSGLSVGAWCEERHRPDAASLEEQAEIMARAAGISSRGFIESADFWKLREISLTITVPEEIVRRSRAAEALSITFSGRNLKTWTDYRGMDPESNFDVVGVADDPGRQARADLLTLPTPRTLVVRVDASF